ncbi:MAG TPA: hypothetical protein ENN03_00865, partial [bacterium]|nr:hypothetical protein [bacterium]
TNGYNWDGSTSGNKIGKSLASTSGWQSRVTAGNVGHNQSTNNSSGFSALPGGYRDFIYGRFYDLIGGAGFWSASEYDTDCAWYRRLSCNSSAVYRYNGYKRSGFSVRLVRE